MVFVYLFFVLVGPFFLIQACKLQPKLNKLGLVVLAYILGLGLSALFPNNDSLYTVKDTMSSILVPLAIPLLLLQTQWNEIRGLAKKSMLSLACGVAAVVVTVVIGFLVFQSRITESYKVGGLLVGAYTGGTPNLASLKLLLEVDEATYLATHSTDMVFSTLYLFFFMTIGQKTIDLVLKKSSNRGSKSCEVVNKKAKSEAEELDSIFRDGNQIQSIKMLFWSVLILGISFGISTLLPSSAQTPIVILGITSLGLIGSAIKRVNRMAIQAYETGMYLILSFSIAVASMIDMDQFAHINPTLFYYIGFTVFGSLTFHILLAKCFNVDTDTLIATSTSLICSPPFVPVVGAALRNRSIIAPGITVGIIGYAIGNYLGFITSKLLLLLS